MLFHYAQNVTERRDRYAGTPVRSFSMDQLGPEKKTGPLLSGKHPGPKPTQVERAELPAGKELSITLPEGGHAVRVLSIQSPGTEPAQLRSLVMTAEFDGEQTIWCPIGGGEEIADRTPDRFLSIEFYAQYQGTHDLRVVIGTQFEGQRTDRIHPGG